VELDQFLNEYFKTIKEVNDFHFKYLVENGFIFPKINYLELSRFLETATNFLLDIDPNLLEGVGEKLYQDIKSLYEFYGSFKKKVKYSEIVFYKEYLENLERYVRLKKRYEELKKAIENYNDTIKFSEEKLKFIGEKDPNYKKLKKQLVDAIYELSKHREEFSKVRDSLKELEKSESLKFFPKFNELKKIHLKKLEKILNVKIFYFDKLLWYRARQSVLVRKFFERSHIEGDFSTKTFIKYYLKNIDMKKAKNSEWIFYLNNLLKVLD